MHERFDYATAFSRNLGWITEFEQAILRRKRVAIAGMGGVGGLHLLTLARLGLSTFRIADLSWAPISTASPERAGVSVVKATGERSVFSFEDETA